MRLPNRSNTPSQQCEATTRKGDRCRMMTAQGNIYCPRHGGAKPTRLPRISKTITPEAVEASRWRERSAATMRERLLAIVKPPETLP